MEIEKNDLSPPVVFNLMAKPAGPACNLACRYCFYLDKEKFFPEENQFRMSDEILENFIKKYIQAQDLNEVCFAWQGGEPTLLGIDFFEKAVELQKKYANGKNISNSFQTNATLIDEEWCQFFKANDFLIGVSLDGPQEIHDYYRVDRAGQGTFNKVVAAIKLMQKFGVEFNILCCVNAFNVKQPLKIYNAFKNLGIQYIQFIPIVERLISEDKCEDDYIPGPAQKYPFDSNLKLAPWSVEAKQYGRFLNTIFDKWVRKDVGQIFVQQFDLALGKWVGSNNSICVCAERCGNAMIIEHNGDIFSCDHYMYSSYKLGNILEDDLRKLVNSDFQRKFGDFKAQALPTKCKECDYLFACRGGCSKHRFLRTKNGENHLNHLCQGFYRFFKHITPAMNIMAQLLNQKQSPAAIMQYMAQDDLRHKVTSNK